MARKEQEQTEVAQQKPAVKERIKVKKLAVKKETVKELSDQESKAVEGGAWKPRGGYSVVACP